MKTPYIVTILTFALFSKMFCSLLEVGEGRSVGILVTEGRGKGVLPPFAFEWHFIGLNLSRF